MSVRKVMPIQLAKENKTLEGFKIKVQVFAYCSKCCLLVHILKGEAEAYKLHCLHYRC